MIMATIRNMKACGCHMETGCTGESCMVMCDLHGGYNKNLYAITFEKIEKILEDTKKNKRKTIPVKKIQRIMLAHELRMGF